MWSNQGPPPPIGLQIPAYPNSAYPAAPAPGTFPQPGQYSSGMSPAAMTPSAHLGLTPYGAPGLHPYPVPPYGAPGSYPYPAASYVTPGRHYYPMAPGRSSGAHLYPVTPVVYPGVSPARVHFGSYPHTHTKWGHHRGHQHCGVHPTSGALVSGMAVVGMGLAGHKANKKMKKMRKKANKAYKHGMHKYCKSSSSSSSDSD
ncbi:proline-rich protein 13-like isoform X2 [Brachionichthys hirsutus]|uniref:proline-rich protein 13-like isoform X2 n=1 Tax=Brachionichthys hirsutus TaxID=412623 RepID=UPI0036052BA5